MMAGRYRLWAHDMRLPPSKVPGGGIKIDARSR
jgi:hypothetical protein